MSIYPSQSLESRGDGPDEPGTSLVLAGRGSRWFQPTFGLVLLDRSRQMLFKLPFKLRIARVDRRDDRRCLHDLIADTVVVDATAYPPPRAASLA